MRCSNANKSVVLVAFGACLSLPGAAAARTLVAESWGSHLAALDLGHQATPAQRTAVSSRGKARPARPAARPVRRSRRGFAQLADGPGIRVRNPERSWGTDLTVSRLREIGAEHAVHFAAAGPLHIHDVSRPSGGLMTPHVSHRNGRDVDIRIPLKREGNAYVSATPSTLDVERTWFLVKRLADTCDVEFIFLDRRLQRSVFLHARSQGTPRAELAALLQYPSRKAVGVVRHSKGHANHIHVRFRHPRARELQQAGREYCKQREQTFAPPALSLAPTAELPPA